MATSTVKRYLRSAVYYAIRGSGLLAFQRARRVRRGSGWAAGLVFHRISAELPEDGLTITPSRFARILGMLRRDYHVISLDQLAGRIERSEPFSGREVIITFDDGYRDNYEVAAPLLLEHGLPACFFLTAGYVGTDDSFPWDREQGRTSGLMSWAEARQLAELGFEIGCHTWSHPDLGIEPMTSVQRELYESRVRIEDAIGRPVQHFAYPFGGRQNIRDSWVQAIRDAGYRTNSSASNEWITATTSPYLIPRIGAAPQRTLAELRIDMDAAW